MKISDGFWMDKKGYDVRYVAQAYQVEMTFYYGDNYLTGGADRATSIIKESNYIRDARLQSQREDDFFHPAKDPRKTYLREQLKTGIEE